MTVWGPAAGIRLPPMFSRSRHSAHLSQASESICHPNWPSRSDASLDAAMQSCARFRQSATVIIAYAPSTLLLLILAQNPWPLNGIERSDRDFSP